MASLESQPHLGEKADRMVETAIQTFDVFLRSSQQAEQLALLIHLKGKATVKTAPRNVLQPKKDALIDRGLSAVIEGERI